MITVCIPCYNHEEFISQAILSCIKAGKNVSQILITDDNSSDNSVETILRLIKQFPKCKYVDPSPGVNLGAHERINILVGQAQTEWVTVLNSDDFFSSGCFSSCHRFIRHHRCNSYFGRINIVDSQSVRLGVKIPGFCLEYDNFSTGAIQDALQQKDWLGLILNQNYIATTSNFCFRREAWEAVGGFEDYRYAHDWSFFINVIANFGTAYNPFHTINYRVHENNTIKESKGLVYSETRRLLGKTVGKIGGIRELHGKSPASSRLLELALENRYFYGHKAYTPYAISNSWPRGTKSFPIRTAKDTSFPPGVHALLESPSSLEINNAIISLESPLVDAVATKTATSPFIKVIGITRKAYENRSISSDRILIADYTNQLPCQLGIDERDLEISGGQLSVNNQLIDIQPFLPNPLEPSRPTHRLIVPPAYSKKKRILILTGFFALGGVERYVLDVIKNLGRFYDFAMICMEPQGKELGSLIDNAVLHGVDIYLLDQIFQADLEGLITRLNASYSFSACWIINGSSRLWAVYPILKSLLPGTIIVDNQVYDHKVGWIEGLPPNLSSLCDIFIAHNQKIYQRFVGDFLIDEDHVVSIYPCFSSSEFPKPKSLAMLSKSELQHQESIRKEEDALLHNLGIIPGSRIYLNVARFDKQKNQSYLLDVAKIMMQVDPQASFLLIGDGPERTDLERKITNLELDNVRLLGFKHNLRLYYQISSMLVITSIFEGLPIVMLEAMATGLPICATDVGDIGYVISKYGYGFLHDGADPYYLAMSLCSSSLSEYTFDIDRFYNEFSSEAISKKYRLVFEGAY